MARRSRASRRRHLFRIIRGLIAGLVVFALSSCGYDGQYRYTCQNPDAWELEECKPPKCSVWGTCPDMLVPSCGAMMGKTCANV